MSILRNIYINGQIFFGKFNNGFAIFLWCFFAIVPVILAAMNAYTINKLPNTNPEPYLTSRDVALAEDSNAWLKPQPKVDSYFPFGSAVTTYEPSKDGIEGVYRRKIHSTPEVAIIATATWIFLLYTVWFLGTLKNPTMVNLSFHKTVPNTDPNKRDPFDSIVDSTTAHKNEIQNFRKVAEEVSRKSTYLLAGGIFMAFVGLLMFYMSAPNIPKDKTIEDYTPVFIEISRSFGMLLFVEALAWFLLKQYRTLQDDYKANLYELSKKTNIFIASLSIDKEAKEERILLLASLLQSNTTATVLKSGETTETLESQKLSNQNPIFDIAKTIIEQVANIKPKK